MSPRSQISSSALTATSTFVTISLKAACITAPRAKHVSIFQKRCRTCSWVALKNCCSRFANRDSADASSSRSSALSPSSHFFFSASSFLACHSCDAAAVNKLYSPRSCGCYPPPWPSQPSSHEALLLCFLAMFVVELRAGVYV